MKIALMLFIVLNLLFSPFSVALAAEAQNPMKMEVVSYKIGNRVIDTTSFADSNTAIVEPKVMTVQGAKTMTMSEASGMPQSKVMTELDNQPIINVKSELSADNKSRKILLKINIENIGSVKAKNVKSVMTSSPTAEALYVKGGKVSAEDATWTGEVEASKSQELVYEFSYQGDATEDLTIPLSISGSGSDEWILNIAFTILKWWLKTEFGFEIPIASNPGFEMILGLSTLITISYFLKNKYRKS